MVVAPRSSDAAGILAIGHDIAVVCKWFEAKRTYSVLRDDLPVEKLAHLTVGAEFPNSVSP